MNNTRDKIINIILSHFLSGEGAAKLKVNDISRSAGISRQAFHRFYSDLKPYIDGTRSPRELLLDESDPAALLNQAHATIDTLKKKILDMEKSHPLELKVALHQHTTSLLNNDLAMIDAHEIRSNAERQMHLIEEYKNTISRLNAQLAATTALPRELDAFTPEKNSIVLKMNFAPPNKPTPPNHDLFEENKDRELLRIAKRINSLGHENLRIILFIENYTSSFDKFVKQWRPDGATPACIVQCPLFSLPELKSAFLCKITTPYKCSIYIPAAPAGANTAATRAFFFRSVPPDEFECADKSDHFFIQKGIDQIIYFDAGSITP